jgi:hypothetical protein
MEFKELAQISIPWLAVLTSAVAALGTLLQIGFIAKAGVVLFAIFTLRGVADLRGQPAGVVVLGGFAI